DPSTGTEKWTQDTDVLDTWFSSWLWPFSTLGWPQKTDDLNYFYPGTTLVTAADIIFFWVARMIMAGLEFMDQIPFEHVYFNGTVRDSFGKKMSKSAGNGIDPLDVIEKFSTDAVRYTVIQLSSQGQDIKLAEKDFEMGRNFSNKIWNSFRFLKMNLDDFNKQSQLDDAANLELVDKWILYRLDLTILNLNKHLDQFRFQDALADIYSFIWNDFCDWYLELIKNRLYQPETPAQRETCQIVAVYCLKKIMICLHPFMPFITEEIWQLLRMNNEQMSIMICDWPATIEPINFNNEADEFELIKELIVGIRNIKAEMNIAGNIKPTVILSSDKDISYLESSRTYFISQGQITDIKFEDNQITELASSSIINGIHIQIPLAGTINIDAEKERLNKELQKKEGVLKSTTAKLANKSFVEKAPPHIVDAEHNKRREIENDIAKLKSTLKQLV
ncbi:MAG: class I tRNA ligase family protein, partial [Calditrichaeota bacterium]|nr:class I tRNA ligase family protein [Calditrichota bacterium]